MRAVAYTCHFSKHKHASKMALLLRLSALSLKPRVISTPLWQRFGAGYGCSSIRVADRPQGHEGCWSNISSPNVIRAFSTDQDLSIKKCVPCNSKDLRAMTDETANVLIQRVPGWNLVNESGVWKLNQSWKVKTFVKGMEFLRLVADVAEAEGHHPDLHLVGWNNVKIDIWTHAVGGLTENDFILAAKINGLNLHHLLRITPTNK